VTDYLPPHDEANEQAVLGAILLGPSTLSGLLADGLTVEHFYRPRWRKVFGAMRALANASEAIDTVTVCGELRRTGELEDAGGEGTVYALEAAVPNAGALYNYVDRLKRLYRHRVRYEVGAQLMAAAYEQDEGAEAAAEARLVENGHDAARYLTPLARQEALMEVLAQGEDALWKTPWSRLDMLLNGGLRRGQLTTVAGWASHGKSVVVTYLLSHLTGQGARCCLYTNEMDATEIDTRSLARESGVAYWRVAQGKLKDGEHAKAFEAVKRIGEDYALVQAAGMTAEEIAADVRRQRWDVAAVDLLNGLPKASETKDIDHNVATLAAASRQANCHVFACQHLNQARHVGKDYPPEPVASDIRGSGAIYNLSNNVVFVYLSEDDSDPGMPGTDAVLKLEKARGGKRGRVQVVFQPARMRFLPVQEEATEPLNTRSAA
jgi:replicative DNA helicase